MKLDTLTTYIWITAIIFVSVETKEKDVYDAKDKAFKCLKKIYTKLKQFKEEACRQFDGISSSDIELTDIKSASKKSYMLHNKHKLYMNGAALMKFLLGSFVGNIREYQVYAYKNYTIARKRMEVFVKASSATYFAYHKEKAANAEL